MPWIDTLLESKNEKAKQILFVIFPSDRGGYNVYTVPTGRREFDSRLLFPENWAGLKNDEFKNKTGIDDVMFCHNARFICGVNTLDAGIEIAKIAIIEGNVID